MTQNKDENKKEAPKEQSLYSGIILLVMTAVSAATYCIAAFPIGPGGDVAASLISVLLAVLAVAMIFITLGLKDKLDAIHKQLEDTRLMKMNVVQFPAAADATDGSANQQ